MIHSATFAEIIRITDNAAVSKKKAFPDFRRPVPVFIQCLKSVFLVCFYFLLLHNLSKDMNYSPHHVYLLSLAVLVMMPFKFSLFEGTFAAVVVDENINIDYDVSSSSPCKRAHCIHIVDYANYGGDELFQQQGVSTGIIFELACGSMMMETLFVEVFTGYEGDKPLFLQKQQQQHEREEAVKQSNNVISSSSSRSTDDANCWMRLDLPSLANEIFNPKLTLANIPSTGYVIFSGNDRYDDVDSMEDGIDTRKAIHHFEEIMVPRFGEFPFVWLLTSNSNMNQTTSSCNLKILTLEFDFCLIDDDGDSSAANGDDIPPSTTTTLNDMAITTFPSPRYVGTDDSNNESNKIDATPRHHNLRGGGDIICI